MTPRLKKRVCVVGAVAQLVENLPSVHKSLGSIPRTINLTWWKDACNPSVKWRQKDQKYKFILS